MNIVINGTYFVLVILQWVIQIFLLTAIVKMKEIKFKWFSTSARADLSSKRKVKQFGCNRIITDNRMKVLEGT